MQSGNGLLNREIRTWLADHPITENQELDIHGVPAGLFDLTQAEGRIKQLNHQIKGLPLRQQKLLLYLSRDIEPALIIESLEYTSPDLFWLDKALLVKEVDPKARKQDVLMVFEGNEALLTEIYAVSDAMDEEEERSKKKKYRRWSLVGVPVILLIVFVFVFPVLIRPDTVALYEKFNTSVLPDLSTVDTTTYNGGSYYEARLMMEEGNFAGSAKLFEELIPADSIYRVGSRWCLALINLRNGDKESCLEQLKAIRNEDPVFYRNVAEKLYRKL